MDPRIEVDYVRITQIYCVGAHYFSYLCNEINLKFQFSILITIELRGEIHKL